MAESIDDNKVCKLCGGNFTVRAILERIEWYWPELNIVVSSSPCCNKSEELQIGYQTVWRGYVYAAATAHYCDVEKYEAPSIEVVGKDAETFTFKLDGVKRVVIRKPLFPNKRPWPFADLPNVAVFTSRQIVDGTDWIHYVSHDMEDGAWQFHGYRGPTAEKDSRVVSLHVMLDLDETIALLANLPLGWEARRQEKGTPWQRQKMA